MLANYCYAPVANLALINTDDAGSRNCAAIPALLPYAAEQLFISSLLLRKQCVPAEHPTKVIIKGWKKE
jgi:hypothetical protein